MRDFADEPEFLDLKQVYSRLRKIAALEAPVAELMARWSQEWHDALPRQNWKQIERIRFASATKDLADWIPSTLSDCPVRDTMVGLWFGCYECADFDDRVEPRLYLAATKRFNVPDWAVSPAWLPHSGYRASRALTRLHRLSVGNFEDQGWEVLGLGLMAFTLKHLLSVVDWQSLLAMEKKRTIGVGFGFDEGDCLTLGSISKGEFRLAKSFYARP